MKFPIGLNSDPLRRTLYIFSRQGFYQKSSLSFTTDLPYSEISRDGWRFDFGGTYGAEIKADNAAVQLEVPVILD